MTIALFRRLPKLVASRGTDHPLVDPATNASITVDDAVARWPLLTTELRDLEEVLVPVYQECSLAVGLEQNRHRRQQVLLLVGGLLTAAFGAVQAALSDSVWPGIVVAGVAAATSAVASIGRESGALDAYLSYRLRAEKLRSTYFTYLTRAEPASDTERREQRCWLQQQVVEIRYDDRSASR
jgi:hypothetical protein